MFAPLMGIPLCLLIHLCEKPPVISVSLAELGAKPQLISRLPEGDGWQETRGHASAALCPYGCVCVTGGLPTCPRAGVLKPTPPHTPAQHSQWMLIGKSPVPTGVGQGRTPLPV